MDEILIMVHFEDNQFPFCLRVLEMTSFQIITFHKFRFQRSMIHRSAGIPFIKLTLKNRSVSFCA